MSLVLIVTVGALVVGIGAIAAAIARSGAVGARRRRGDGRDSGGADMMPFWLSAGDGSSGHASRGDEYGSPATTPSDGITYGDSSGGSYGDGGGGGGGGDAGGGGGGGGGGD